MNTIPPLTPFTTSTDTTPPSQSDPVTFYRDPLFVNSAEARPVRIMSEYHGPQALLKKHNITDTIVFFGSARIHSLAQAEHDLAMAQAGQSSLDVETARKRLNMSKYYEDCRELAHRLTIWSHSLKSSGQRFVVCSGAGPGLMAAANQGAHDAGGDSLGLGISLPFEDTGNPFITNELNFQFHYFFMRKYWFAYLAKAFVVMPGGFGTLDEVMEILTLRQTGKMTKKVPIILYGTDFWNKVIDFNALVEFGTISAEDLDLFHLTDSIDDAFDLVTRELLARSLHHPGGSM